MRTKGRGKRRVAIILAMIMTLQCCVFAQGAFAATDEQDGYRVTVHFENIMQTNGTYKELTDSNTLKAGSSWSFLQKKLDNKVSYKTVKVNGLTYTYTGEWADRDGNPVSVPVRFYGKDLTEDMDIYIHPVYTKTGSVHLQYTYTDNISTGSGSWADKSGFDSSYTHTYSDPSVKTPVEHYSFVNWTNFETGKSFAAGEKDTITKDMLQVEPGETAYMETTAVWQPSVIVNWHSPAGILHTEESFTQIAAGDYTTDSYTAEVGGETVTFSFTGWTDAAGNAADSSIYEAPAVTTVPVNQKTIDLFANYATSKSVNVVFNDAADKDGIRPESMEVTLYANGEAAGTAVISAENGWAYTFEALPAYANGEAVSYTVDTEAPADYEKEIESTVLADTITVSHEPAVVDITNDSIPVLPAGPTAPMNDDSTPAAPAAAGTKTANTQAANTQAAPAQTAQQAAAQNEIVEDTMPMAAPVSVEIEDNAAPQAAGTGYWALLNLLLAAGSALVSILALAFYFIKRRDEEDEAEEEERDIRRKGLVRVLTLLPAAAAIITFLLTENMANPMRLADGRTLLMAVFFTAGLLLAALSRKSEKNEENKEAAAAATM